MLGDYGRCVKWRAGLSRLLTLETRAVILYLGKPAEALYLNGRADGEKAVWISPATVSPPGLNFSLKYALTRAPTDSYNGATILLPGRAGL